MAPSRERPRARKGEELVLVGGRDKNELAGEKWGGRSTG